MNAKVKPIPEGMHSLTPHLICRDANAAMDFYVKAFGAIDQGRMTGPDGTFLMHGMMRIGDSALMLVDENPDWGMRSPLALNGSPVTVHLYVEDVDATIAQAVAAGARVTMPAQDMFWGDRYGKLVDPFGHEWSVATHIRELSSDEIQAAAKAAFCSEA
ncbi:MAG: VOC family protein [Halioglobus sp.]|nr:VOC family protein [Halioglobus sp.]